MYLKQTYNKKTDKTYLSMVHNYRDKEKGYSRTKTVETFGYLDELEKIYEDPVDHFKNIVKERNLADKLEAAEYIITAKKSQTIEKNTTSRKNYGYIIIMKLFCELGLDRLLINRQQRGTKIEYDTNAILKMLVVSRILSPGSKKRAYDEMARYFDFERKDAFELTDVYRSLSFFAGLSKDVQLLVHDRINKNYGRDLNLVYYDVTNYYFEIDKEDELRRKGYGKDNKPYPLVQMGLAMDGDGLPVSYELFPGNESEKLHLRPMVSELLRKYGVGSVIAVADSAQNTGNNVYYLDQGRQGYVFSQSIRGGSEVFKEYVVDPSGYVWHGDDYKKKSRIERRAIQVDFERADGTTYKKDVFVDQRQIVFYSEKYAVRSRAKRDAVIKKAQKIIANPSAYTRATSYGALRFIKNVEVDRKTGEIKETKCRPCFDMDVIKEEEKYDGYYAIVTNLFDEGKNNGKFGDGRIIDLYRGLWRIEDSFRVTKQELEARPVFLSREDRINAHFLICYIALVIVCLVQKLTGQMYSAAKLIEAMNNISCSHEGGNLFLFDYRSDVSDALGDAFGIDFTKQRLTRKEIKKNLGEAKKS